MTDQSVQFDCRRIGASARVRFHIKEGADMAEPSESVGEGVSVAGARTVDLDGARVAAWAACGDRCGEPNRDVGRQAAGGAEHAVGRRGDRGGRRGVRLGSGRGGRGPGPISRTSRPMMPSSPAMRRPSPAVWPTSSRRCWSITMITSIAGRFWSVSIDDRSRSRSTRCGRTCGRRS